MQQRTANAKESLHTKFLSQALWPQGDNSFITKKYGKLNGKLSILKV